MDHGAASWLGPVKLIFPRFTGLLRHLLRAVLPALLPRACSPRPRPPRSAAGQGPRGSKGRGCSRQRTWAPSKSPCFTETMSMTESISTVSSSPKVSSSGPPRLGCNFANLRLVYSQRSSPLSPVPHRVDHPNDRHPRAVPRYPASSSTKFDTNGSYPSASSIAPAGRSPMSDRT